MNRRARKVIRLVALYGISVGASAFALVPVVWALVTSLKKAEAALAYPPRWFPWPPTFQNFHDVLFGSNMPRYFLNSGITVGGTILLSLLVGSLAGYAASRYRFPGKNSLMMLLLVTIMIPGIVTLVPVYLLVVKVGLLNTYAALILTYSAWQVPTVTWLMRGFFDTVPKEMEESALIDGCTPLSAFYRIAVPLMQPGLAATALIVFVWVWNEFLIGLTLTASDNMRLVPVGLYTYVSAFGIEWTRLMAAVCLALLPVVAVFLFLQRRFIQGLTSGGVKN